jgi:hypothetical protein
MGIKEVLTEHDEIYLMAFNVVIVEYKLDNL